MSFKNFSDEAQGIALLQRSLERGRLGHAYLFMGHELGELSGVARTLAKTLNCQKPLRSVSGAAIDCCDVCLSCRKIEGDIHPDIHWVRPESKLRVVKIEQMRELMREIQLKPTEAEYKVGVIVASDRLNVQAANAFLKTLEEPPSKSVLILLSTEPARILETILSRCLRLNFGRADGKAIKPETLDWLKSFSDAAAAEQKSLLERYRLLGVLVKRLGEMKEQISGALEAQSPLEKYEDAEKDLREQWEKELDAAIESEYRLQRADVLVALQLWLRDVWVRSLNLSGDLLVLPQLKSSEAVARRVAPEKARENLRVIEETQRLLMTNVQEALALEVGLLKLNL